MFRRKGSSRPENITNTSDRVNHRPLLINLAAQSMDQHIYDICLGIKTVIKNVFQDHGLRDRAISMAHQVLEQSEFAGLQLDFLARALDLASEQVHRKITHDEASGLRSLSRAPNQRLDTRQKLG